MSILSRRMAQETWPVVVAVAVAVVVTAGAVIVEGRPATLLPVGLPTKLRSTGGTPTTPTSSTRTLTTPERSQFGERSPRQRSSSQRRRRATSGGGGGGGRGEERGA